MKSIVQILESTLSTLRGNTERLFGQAREDDSGTIRVVNFVVINHSNALEVKANVHNTNDRTDHHVKILYEGVDIGPEGEKGLDIMTYTGDIVSVDSNQLESVDVKVVCNCLDFYWRFAMWNHADGSLLGPKPKPYIKKTNRPPNNPSKTPGMCKHMIAVVDHFTRVTS